EGPRETEGGAEEPRGGEAQTERAHHLREQGRVDTLTEVQQEGDEEEPGKRGGCTSRSSDRTPPAAVSLAGGRARTASNIARRGAPDRSPRAESRPTLQRGSAATRLLGPPRTRGNPRSIPPPSRDGSSGRAGAPHRRTCRSAP